MVRESRASAWSYVDAPERFQAVNKNVGGKQNVIVMMTISHHLCDWMQFRIPEDPIDSLKVHIPPLCHKLLLRLM
jgi:hypothetical protein